MKIKTQDIEEWIEKNITITYSGGQFKMRHQGLTADGKPNGSPAKVKPWKSRCPLEKPQHKGVDEPA